MDGGAKCLVSRTRVLRPERGLLEASHLLSPPPRHLSRGPVRSPAVPQLPAHSLPSRQCSLWRHGPVLPPARPSRPSGEPHEGGSGDGWQWASSGILTAFNVEREHLLLWSAALPLLVWSLRSFAQVLSCRWLVRPLLWSSVLSSPAPCWHGSIHRPPHCPRWCGCCSYCGLFQWPLCWHSCSCGQISCPHPHWHACWSQVSGRNFLPSRKYLRKPPAISRQ